jgi:hypothetical protein
MRRLAKLEPTTLALIHGPHTPVTVPLNCAASPTRTTEAPHRGRAAAPSGTTSRSRQDHLTSQAAHSSDFCSSRSCLTVGFR